MSDRGGPETTMWSRLVKAFAPSPSTLVVPTWDATVLAQIGDPDPIRSACEAAVMAAALAGQLNVEVAIEGGETKMRARTTGGVPAITRAPVAALDRRGTPPDPGGPCPGRIVIHDDGHTSCHSGREDCWPGITTYRHQGTPIPCGEMSHGCGSCLTTPEHR